jgi:predicted RNA-binding Zn-ribbon protein involved in translation (DUF1610 family)
MVIERIIMDNEPFPPPGYIPLDSAIDGIEVFGPAPTESSPGKEIVDFKCPQCGATTAFSASDGGLTCTHCGYYEAPEKPIVGRMATEFEFTIETMERAAQGWGEVRKELACQNCGAVTSIPFEELSYNCPFCGSNQVIQRQAAQDMLRPRFLIPFKLDGEKCSRLAIEWLGNSWMVPRSLKKAVKMAALSAVYLPFWTFDSLITADWKAEVGHTEIEKYYSDGEWKTRSRTKWEWESGNAQLSIDDLIVQGTENISRLLMGKIDHFNLSQLAPYEPKYLAGMRAKAYDISLEKAWEAGRQKMRQQAHKACISQASTTQIRNFRMSIDFADESWRYVLLPVYMASYRYQNKAFQVVVNGQSGEISGQRPPDWLKIWLVISLLLLPGIFLGVIGLLAIPLGGVGIGIGGLGFILLIIGLIVGVVIFQKAQGLDDV